MLVSIIIPVYNALLYLERCLDSILAQSYENFELLIINDGSEDDSLRICRKYEQQDKRVKVFNKQNGGVSSARNTGLNNASGEWICFIDSDDYVEQNHLEQLATDVEENVDFIMHGKYGNSKSSHPNYNFKIVDTANKQELFEAFKISPNGQPFSKLFRHTVIKKYNINFAEEVKISADVLFVLEYLSKVDKLKYRNSITYHYIRYKDSLSHKITYNYRSDYAGFKKINNILYYDFNLPAIDTHTHLKRTYLNFLLRAVHGLNSNTYTKSERLYKYEELYACLKFKNISVDGRGLLHKLVYKLFFNRKFISFDFFINSKWERKGLYHIYKYVESFIEL
jgi:glycosyltransferase involved in cell wall biosynthesis